MNLRAFALTWFLVNISIDRIFFSRIVFFTLLDLNYLTWLSSLDISSGDTFLWMKGISGGWDQVWFAGKYEEASQKDSYMSVILYVLVWEYMAISGMIGKDRLGYSTVFMLGAMLFPEGLLLECTSDVNRVWSPSSVPRWSSTARLITIYLVNMIKVWFCSNNDGDY